jgi:ribosomal protein S18 acetylase RimI-like enzyme
MILGGFEPISRTGRDENQERSTDKVGGADYQRLALECRGMSWRTGYRPIDRCTRHLTVSPGAAAPGGLSQARTSLVVRLQFEQEMNLKQATLNDTNRLMPLMRAYHDFEGISASDSDRLRVINPLLSTDGHFGRVWLIETSTDTVGYIALCFGYSIEFGGRDAFVDEFFIMEGARGHGLGRMALEAVKRAAESEGVRALHLEVARTNSAAKNFYSKLGFTSRGKFQLMSCRLGNEA